jgi:DNA-binding transcriptional ArsR family regulator
VVTDIQETYLIASPEQALALLNPVRGDIVAQLIEPASAAEVARALGDTPQRINYHLKTLEKVGLVRRCGTRQVRNLVEVLFQAVARSFVLAESLSMKPETAQKLKDQGALANLIQTAERLKQDALVLMERSDRNVQVPSASLQLNVPLCDEAQRAAFVEDYVAAVQALVSKYTKLAEGGGKAYDSEGDINNGRRASTGGKKPYQVVLAVYPKPD